MITEREWYGSEEHFRTEKSYAQYISEMKNGKIKQIINAASKSSRDGIKAILK